MDGGPDDYESTAYSSKLRDIACINILQMNPSCVALIAVLIGGIKVYDNVILRRLNIVNSRSVETGKCFVGFNHLLFPFQIHGWWTVRDLNPGPDDYESTALTC